MWITRELIKLNPKTVFVFGDNVDRMGFGGQAKECRGEANTIGVRTKWSPGTKDRDYFSDDNYERIKVLLDEDLDRIKSTFIKGYKIVLLPGIGSGMAEMPKRCPRLYQYLIKELDKILFIVSTK
jgi:hypothetical protein